MKAVYFSKWIKTGYKAFAARLIQALDELDIDYGWLPDTKDIWCRDFMPVALGDGRYVQYRYEPDYLRENPAYRKYITDPEPIIGKMNLDCRKTDLVLDGGNLMRIDDFLVMTDKVFAENPGRSEREIREELERVFEAELLLLPWDRREIYGHSDGLVRRIGPGKVLFTNYRDYDERLAGEMERRLAEKFQVERLAFDVDHPHPHNWCYINYLEAGDALLVPALGTEEDAQALEQLQRHFPAHRIRQVLMPEIVKQGGALNCISWNAAGRQTFRKK